MLPTYRVTNVCSCTGSAQVLFVTAQNIELSCDCDIILLQSSPDISRIDYHFKAWGLFSSFFPFLSRKSPTRA
jgi:hypothetical protein